MDKSEYYLNIAKAVAQKSTCFRRKFGAVIVNNDEIVSTGYNGAPRERQNCKELGYCIRNKLNIPHGQRYELCRSVHAEQNAIISASRKDMIGSTLYLVGVDTDTGECVDSLPCIMCERFIINSGIKYICSYMKESTYYKTFENKNLGKDRFILCTINVERLIKQDDSITGESIYESKEK